MYKEDTEDRNYWRHKDWQTTTGKKKERKKMRRKGRNKEREGEE